MPVIIKKNEKAEAILKQMSDIGNSDEFVSIFKEQYTDDYQKLMKTYIIEERKDKKGKGHPMPHPDQYLRNMYHVALKKSSEK